MPSSKDRTRVYRAYQQALYETVKELAPELDVVGLQPGSRGDAMWTTWKRCWTKDAHYLRNFRKDVRREWLPHEVEDRIGETYEKWINELWPEASDPRPAEELYLLSDDPREWTNRAGDPDVRELQQALERELDTWMRATGDFLITGHTPIPGKGF